MNFGAFVTPEDNILFNINDFDETLPNVDFTVDVKRLATSIAIAAAAQGSPMARRRELVVATVRAYRKRMEALTFLTPLEVWHSRIDLELETKKFRDAAMRRKMLEIIARARGEGLDKDNNFPTLAESGAAVIHDKAPRMFHYAAGSDAAKEFDVRKGFAKYRANMAPEVAVLYDRYELKDFVFKAVGVGSVGTYCYVGLFMSGDEEPMFLQIKEASRSVLEVLDEKMSFEGHQGRRVVEGQRKMQAASDIFLGWTQSDESGREFYVRILKNRRLGGISDIAGTLALGDYARLCGRTLARAHARTGDPALISGYMGDSDAFDEAIADFAQAYEQRNEADHAAWAAAWPPNPAAGK
jgi:uncharacterized protein (DUF2252 family)